MKKEVPKFLKVLLQLGKGNMNASSLGKEKEPISTG